MARGILWYVRDRLERGETRFCALSWSRMLDGTGPLGDAASAVTAVVRFAELYGSTFSPSTLTLWTGAPGSVVATTNRSWRSQSTRTTPVRDGCTTRICA